MTLKRFLILLGLVLMLLLIPLIAMQVSKEVQWSVADFGIAAFLLFSLGWFIDLAWRKVPSKPKRFLSILLILILFALIWAELAVGIFS